MQVVSNVIYAGGEFPYDYLDHPLATNLVALDRVTAVVLPWNPTPNGRVCSLVTSSNLLFVGGEFTTIAGQTRNGLAAFDLATRDLTPWDPCGTNLNTVRTLALAGDSLYVAGTFQNIGGQPRTNLASLDITTGNATAWSPSVTNQINAMVVVNDAVYVGGGLDYPVVENGVLNFYPFLKAFPPEGWSVLSQAHLTNGSVGFRLLGEEGGNYVIEASASLTSNWSPVFTNTVANGGFDYSEPATNTLPRYYRALARP